MEIIQESEIVKIYDDIKNKGILTLTEDDKTFKKDFIRDYSIDRLMQLSGRKLLYSLFGTKDQQNEPYSISYLFEYRSESFGIFTGPANQKIPVSYCKTKKDKISKWRDSDNVYSEEEAIKIAEQFREKLIDCNKLLKNNNLQDFIARLNQEKFYIFLHKYFYILYPNLLCSYHSKNYSNLSNSVTDYIELKNGIMNFELKYVQLAQQKSIKMDDIRKTIEYIINKKALGGQPLNQILYGPPGTGKTYTIDKIIKENIYPQIQQKNITDGDIDYDTLLENEFVATSPWWIKIALALKLQGNNPLNNKDISKLPLLYKWYKNNDYKNEYTFERSVNAELQKCTKGYKTNRHDLSYFTTSKSKNDILFSISQEGLIALNDYLNNYDIQIPKENNNDKNLLANKAKSYYTFVTFHQSYSYEEFVEGIKPVIKKATVIEENDEQISDNTSLNYEYNVGIFKSMCIKAQKEPDKKFFIFIDEINRGNISKIFGELITLIEPDKRKNVTGDDREYHTLEVTLPYSKDPFYVPNNLYIIGTMNTSDRSIASIDIALRRRFKFVEMMPKPELFENVKIQEFNDKNTDKKEQKGLKDLLETLNQRISILLDRDHQIGHSYFIKFQSNEKIELSINALKDIWFDEIMPLLNEYFYGDWEKLQAILGEAKKDNSSFIKIIENVSFATKYTCDDEEKCDFNAECNFEEAMKNAFKNLYPTEPSKPNAEQKNTEGQ